MNAHLRPSGKPDFPGTQCDNANRELGDLIVLDSLEAVRGATRVAFDAGFTHYDDPPPDVIEDLEALRKADRFRFANVLSAWIDVDDNGKSPATGTRGEA